MSHVVVPNYTPIAQTEYFQGIWKLTRAMLMAGWRYKASADATGTSTNKDTSSNPANDKWAVGGGTNLTQVGAQTATGAFTIGAPSAGVSVVTGVSGFTANSVGRFLVITGALNANNNGTFRITAQGGTSVTIFNPGAVSETTPAASTWTEMQGGSAASIATQGTAGATPHRAILTGLTGMVPSSSSPLNPGSVGTHITIIGAATGANNGTFRVTRVISTTSVEIDNASAVTDANNGAIIWVQSSPLLQTYPVSLQGATGAGAWLVLQGPSIMKIPVGTNVPTGSFVRGELVTQTNSGATGTLLGIVTDTATGLGFATIAPRLDGTGGGIRGWTTGGTDTLTGAISGATITSANITPIEFVHEFVFWKSTAAAGHIYVQCVDQNLESASRFSVIAANAGITNVLAPGSSAGPGFPTAGTYVLLGTGATAAVATGAANWGSGSYSGNTGNSQIMCANCVETSTTDADGSFILAQGNPVVANNAYGGVIWQRCDSSEEGDVDPYVSYSPAAGSYDGTRTTGTNAPANTDLFNSAALGTSTSTYWKGWRRRGFPTGDAFQQFQGHMLATIGAASPQCVINGAYGRVQHALNEQMIREAAWMISTQIGQRMRKGFMRWLAITEGGVTGMTYSSGQYVQLSTSNTAPLIGGPWDGQSVAQNA